MLDKKIIHQIAQTLSENSKIALITHYNPDGDAIGSLLALWFYFRKKYSVSMITPNDFPEFYKWMPDAGKIHIATKDRAKCEEILLSADVIFCLDFNTPERVGKLSDALLNSKAKKVLIDHHLYPSDIFDIKLTIIDTSSTAEMIYEFIVGMGDEDLIDYETALAIFVGIITDTGSFSYSCNRPRTYVITSRLIERGINAAEVQRLVFWNFSENRLRLLGYCLSEKLTIIKEFSTAYISITKEEKKRFHYSIGDNEGIVNYGLTIKGIKLAALFTEMDGYIKLSLRSVGDLNVDEMARAHFNGAGHKNAAGANIYSNMNEAIQSFQSVLPKYADFLK